MHAINVHTVCLKIVWKISIWFPILDATTLWKYLVNHKGSGQDPTPSIGPFLDIWWNHFFGSQMNSYTWWHSLFLPDCHLPTERRGLDKHLYFLYNADLYSGDKRKVWFIGMWRGNGNIPEWTAITDSLPYTEKKINQLSCARLLRFSIYISDYHFQG